MAIADNGVRTAVSILERAGMNVFYVNAHGSSVYLNWRGRKGNLRVSNHGSSRSIPSNPTIHHWIVSKHTMPNSAEAWERSASLALGRYLLNAPIKDMSQEYLPPTRRPASWYAWLLAKFVR